MCAFAKCTKTMQPNDSIVLCACGHYALLWISVFCFSFLVLFVYLNSCDCSANASRTQLKKKKKKWTHSMTPTQQNCHSIVIVAGKRSTFVFWMWNSSYNQKELNSMKAKWKIDFLMEKRSLKEKVHRNAIVVAIRYHISDSRVALKMAVRFIMRIVLVHMNSPHLTSQPFRVLRIRCRGE